MPVYTQMESGKNREKNERASTPQPAKHQPMGQAPPPRPSHPHPPYVTTSGISLHLIFKLELQVEIRNVIQLKIQY